MSKTSDTWRNKRRTLWRQSGGRCHYCGRLVPEEALRTSDHVVPKAFGGPRALWNLVASCAPCNERLGDAVHKCECRSCRRAVENFHKVKQGAGRTGAVIWERREHRSNDWLVQRLLANIHRVQRALERIEDKDSRDAAALRGKLNGYRDALAMAAVNKVIDDATLDEKAVNMADSETRSERE